MKKPLILLVDDNRAVLEALEAELAPAFRDIACIEAFDDPRAVLNAMPGWAAEERQIAVAIVDQKMPEMTGVELLAAMRSLTSAELGAANDSTHPIRFTRTLMLTGYAGLDSAIAARNDCGVHRYLEKPWPAATLEGEVRGALQSWLRDGVNGLHYVMRETCKRDEVRELFRLRFSIYAETSHLAVLIPKDTGEMEVDGHDARANLFGLMFCSSTSETMVGALRVVGQDESPQLSWAREVTAEYPLLTAKLSMPPQARLPLLEYIPERVVVEQLVDDILSRGERVTEPSRLVLSPDFRSRAPGSSQHLARQIIESAVAFFFFFFRIPHAILTCAREHRIFYRPYGFKLTEGTQIQLYPKFGKESACLHGTMTSVPAEARDRCDAIATRIRRTGGACRCATFPACLGGPHESGDFSSVDLFCPLRAKELVTISE